MYPAYIGKRFLKLYNERKGTSYNAREFFDEVIFKIFFDAEKDFMNVSNSSFARNQSIGKEDLKQSGLNEPLYRLQRFHSNVENREPDGSIMVGYSASKLEADTSGQVSNLPVPTDVETVYASWIGGGFAISMGDFTFFSTEDDLLWILFEGWKDYRGWLDQSNLKGNQIETWNALWLCHVLDRRYRSGLGLKPKTKEIKTEKKGVLIGLEGKGWQEIIFALSKKFGDKQIVINVCNLDKSNKTVGFIPIQLSEIRGLFEMYDFLHGKLNIPIEEESNLDRLYKVEFSFGRACSEGAIRLRSLEPKNLSKYLSSPKGPTKIYDFINYQTWILTMLNNNELYDLSVKVAGTLIEYEAGNIRDNTRKKKVKDFLESTTRRVFNNHATEIIKEEPSLGDLFNDLVKNAHSLPADNLPLFISLIKFQYFYQKGKSNSPY